MRATTPGCDAIKKFLTEILHYEPNETMRLDHPK
jgi:hypothetical protein